MNSENLAKACNFLLTRLQIFVTWVPKPSVLFKLTPKKRKLATLLIIDNIVSDILVGRWGEGGGSYDTRY